MTRRVVLWDFDGTLAVREGMWAAALIEALAAVDPAHRLVIEDVRPGLRGGFPWHRPDEGHPHIDSGPVWWEALAPVLIGAYESAGVERPIAVRAAALVPECYVEPSRWSLVAGILPALVRLSDAGWRHLIVSNHVPELPGLVRALGLDGAFDHILTSAAVGYEKPNPRMFQAALQRAGAPEEVWMVGDNPVADVAGASAAGIPALLLRSRKSPDGLSPAEVVERILGG